MRRSSYILLALLLTACSCSTAPTRRSLEPKTYVAPELVKYLLAFRRDYREHVGAQLNTSLVKSIDFDSYLPHTDEDGSIVLGSCIPIYGDYVYNDIRQEIVGRIYWMEIHLAEPAAYNWRFRALIYHEMGHCFLGLEHTPEPATIMHAYSVMSEEYIRDNWSDLVSELFREYRDLLSEELHRDHTN